MTSFVRYSLRTLDVPAARAFYLDTLGLDIPSGPAAGPLEVWPLHERARAAGIPAHWLGQIHVDDPEAVRDAVVAAGGMALGPLVDGPHGRYATVRDPWGAVFAASTATVPEGPSPVVWCHLHTRDPHAARALYGRLFGWGTEDGLSSAPGADRMGSVSGLLPGAHPHWAFLFAVD
ncbi:MAG: hypothetical protein KC656_35820, partial [Myxococcales bacterium]|nr:hypothetical protein [Myxococcales bacterium]